MGEIFLIKYIYVYAYWNFKDGKNRRAKTVVYYKSLNQDTINYVVQAVPDTKRKILYINSAYKNKKEANHLPNALSPNATSDNDGELTSFDGDRIPLSEDVVKNSLKNGMSKREIALAEQVEFWKQEAAKEVTVITKAAAIVIAILMRCMRSSYVMHIPE